MKKVCKLLLQPLYVAMMILSILRIYLGWAVGVWFPAAQLWDDALMMGYSDIAGHFLNPARYSLLKDMSFPLFLKLSSVLHIPYSITLALLWIAAALVVFFVVKRLVKSKWFSFASFVYVLFMPQAFEIWCGTRLYRNAIIAPFAIITISLMLNMIFMARSKGKKRAENAVFLGILFTFTYYIKEDGIWLMACLVFASLCGLVFALVSKEARKTAVQSVSIMLIPFVIFAVSTEGYKAINYKYFGVYEINTRTGGEYGKFVENIYKISSRNRSMSVWTPRDAILKAFSASETLREYPELLDAIMKTEWQGGSIADNPIPGDHFNWILREEMYNIGIYYSEAWVDEFFSKVNSELAEAFKSGELEKQKGVIQIVSSAGGYTWEEIGSLKEIVVSGFKGAVMLDGYKLGLSGVGPEEIAQFSSTVEYAKGITKLSYLSDYTEFREKSDSLADKMAPITIIYKIFNIILLSLTLLIIFYELICIIINVKRVKTFLQSRCKIYLGVFGAFVFLGISICYATAISWFSAFLFTDGINMTILNFYNIALPGLLMFSYVFTSYTIREEIKLFYDRKGIKS